VPETYSPTVGMKDVTQANDHILINFSADDSGAHLQFFNIEPDTPLRVTMKRGDTVLFDEAVTADPQHGNHISTPLPAGGSSDAIRLAITTSDGRRLIAAEAKAK
jgi:hypothetical protein